MVLFTDVYSMAWSFSSLKREQAHGERNRMECHHVYSDDWYKRVGIE